MSDLTQTLQEGLRELDEVTLALNQGRRSAGEARAGLTAAAQRLETQAAQLPESARTTLDRLRVEEGRVETGSQRLSQQIEVATAWTDKRRLQLDQERAQLAEEMAALRLELERAEVELAESRRVAIDTMQKSSQATLLALTSLAADMDVLGTWVSGQLTPYLRRQRLEVDVSAEALRVQVLDQTLPAITREYEIMKAHLEQLALDLSVSLDGNSAESAALARYALEKLAQTMNTLCACNAEEMRATVKVLEGEQRHLRARSDDLYKHAKVYAELGTPAALQLGLLVNVIYFVEDLLIESKVLPPRPEDSGGML